MLKFCIGNDLFQLSDMLEYFEHITDWGSGLKIPNALYIIISYSSFVCVCVCVCVDGFHACCLLKIPMKNTYIFYHVRGMNRAQEMTM